MILAERLHLDPNNVQRTWLDRCAGAARFAFNWGLTRWEEIYAAGGKPSWQAINKILNACKTAEFPWLRELPWKVPNQALEDLGVAFREFFRRAKAGAKRVGYPKLKKKGRCNEGFAIEAREIIFKNYRLKVPKIGWLRLHQMPRFPGKIISARFTKHADCWYVALQVEIDESSWSYPHRCKTQAVVGMDLGLVNLVTSFDGTTVDKVVAPRPWNNLEKQRRKLNKELHRRKEGGRNRERSRRKFAKLCARAAAIRHATIHIFTATLVENFRWIGTEDLNLQGMMQSHFAGALMDTAFGEVVRQLRYKANLAGSTVVPAQRFFPSSKTCSECGAIHTGLKVSERHWVCPTCSAKHDRDENAAKNLYKLALAAAHAATACCHESTDEDRKTLVKLSLGQELGSHTTSSRVTSVRDGNP